VTRVLRTRVLVVGGGINGTGIARDLALRGVPVVLAERRELGSGTSWASSGMIHGGLRYLQKDPEVTQHSCADSGAIQRIAPHLVFRIPFLMPVFPDDPLGPELVEIGLEMYDRFVPLKNGRPHTRLTRTEALALEPALSERIECAFTLDEWGVDAARLCVANALDAADRGATVLTHTEVVEILRDASGAVTGARLFDRIRGDEAVVEEVLRPSADRVTPRCAHFGICNGCALQHLAPTAQIAAKQHVLLENFERIGKVRPQQILPAAQPVHLPPPRSAERRDPAEE
jgi:glycerol-3-phosphate dehydrogenase